MDNGELKLPKLNKSRLKLSKELLRLVLSKSKIIHLKPLVHSKYSEVDAKIKAYIDVFLSFKDRGMWLAHLYQLPRNTLKD